MKINKLLPLSLFLLVITNCQAPKSSDNEEPQKLSKVAEAIGNFPRLEGKEKHKAMVLGTFHFNRNLDGSDVVSKNHIDVMSEISQEGLEDIIAQIVTEFKPTKVAVEWRPNLQPTVDSLYQEYLNGTWKLGKHETFQLGFRIASKMGLPGITCIDNRPRQPESVLSLDDWDTYARENGYEEIWHEFDDENAELNAYMDKMFSELTLKEYFAFLNQKDVAQRFKKLWVTGLVNLGQGDNYAGADLTGHWFQRNTRIFTNIRKLMGEEEEQRVLVIYGQSHKWILDELLETSPEIELLQPDFD